ncbi:MAG TPA: sulfotransferase [Bacillales bacterium]|nr:sulfotransferase [Bacillales bacterium]
MDHKKPIMLSGLPRSGTTWTSDVLKQADDIFYMHEPDNERLYLKTLLLKDEVHRYPYLKKGQEAPLYHKLWKDLFESHSYAEMFPSKYEVNAYEIEETLGKKSGEVHDSFFKFTDESAKDKTLKKRIDHRVKPPNKRLFIKSIYNMLALDWLEEQFNCNQVVIIRHPANVISSYLKLKFPDSARNIFSQEALVNDYFGDIMPEIEKRTDVVEEMAAQIGGIYSVLEKQLESHPNWILLRHEELCENPVQQFKELYGQLGLKWTKEVKKYIVDANEPGKGFKAKRVASEEIQKYKKLLSEEQISKIREVYELFGNPFYEQI